MKRFEVTAPQFEGRIVFGFDEESGRLTSVDISEARLKEPQWRWIWGNLPGCPDVLKTKKWTAMSVTELVEDVTFDMFWQRYDDKARSSKIKTQRQWDKMPAHEQAKAYRFIPNYFASIPQGVCKKYATTYLSDQLWNN